MSTDAEEFVSYVAWDWLQTRAGRVLHHATLTPEQVDVVDWFAPSVRLSCGRVTDAWIPGVFSRLCAARCAQCCRATGTPPGVGSPKNDPACRPLLGLT